MPIKHKMLVILVPLIIALLVVILLIKYNNFRRNHPVANNQSSSNLQHPSTSIEPPKNLEEQIPPPWISITPQMCQKVNGIIWNTLNREQRLAGKIIANVEGMRCPGVCVLSNYNNIPLIELGKTKQAIPGIYRLQGFVNKKFFCPPCPPESYCKPCQNYIVISSNNKILTNTNEIAGLKNSLTLDVNNLSPQKFEEIKTKIKEGNKYDFIVLVRSCDKASKNSKNCFALIDVYKD